MSTKYSLQNRSNLLQYPDRLATIKDLMEFVEPFGLFRQMEAAVVLDVVLDKNHPQIKRNPMDVNEIPFKYDGKKHINSDKLYTTIGSIKYRLLDSQGSVSREELTWAFPLEKDVTQFPLINEVVLIVSLGHPFNETKFYTRPLNFKNFINLNADFRYEKHSSLQGFLNFDGIESTLTENTITDSNQGTIQGSVGKYFKFNNKIRPLIHFEGDTLFESRFGSSIRFGSYENDEIIDKGNQNDYVYKDNGGNPKIIIRNKQRNLTSSDLDSSVNGKYDANCHEANILEDINLDGTNLQITSGRTVSKINFKFINKSIFSNSPNEEQISFSPDKSTSYTIPSQDFPPKDNSNIENKEKQNSLDVQYMVGNQTVLATDRIIFQSRKNETIHLSKRRYSIVTDDEYTVDSHKQIVLTTNSKTVLNSPFIYLGQYNETHEPAVLGQTLMEWLYDLCDWLRSHTHIYEHVHEGSGGTGTDGLPTNPNTQYPNQIQQPETAEFKLEKLRDRLDDILSRRVFLTGGGYAPGSNGSDIIGNDNSTTGTLLNKKTGAGVPGGFTSDTPTGSGNHIKNKSSK
jgi:hypothetical protein